MQHLVLIQRSPVLALGVVNDPVQDEFDAAEDEAAGDGPDGGGVNEAVRRHAHGPDSHRSRGILPLHEQMAVLAGREELALQRIIHQRMTGEQQEDGLDGFQ